MRILPPTILTLGILAVMAAGCTNTPSPAPSKKPAPEPSAKAPAPADAGEFVLNVPGMH